MRCLIDSSGRAAVGIFPDAVGEVNFRDYELRTPLGRPAGRLARHFGFNQFQFLGALSEELVFGCALADIRYAGTAFVYLFDPRSCRLTERSFQRPLAIGVTFDQRPEDGRASFHSGAVSIEMSAGAEPYWRRLVVRCGDEIEIEAQFDEQNPRQQPMRICTRAGATGWVFARKTAGMPVSGSVRWGREKFDLAAIKARGHCDWSAGYMRRETFWNWGCLAGAATDGRVIGLNVSCGVNETSFTENCFWVDGVLHKVDTVRFDYDPSDLMRPWRLGSYDGRVALEFVPESRHAENINALIVASNFNQLIGRYFGRMTTANGETLEVDSVLGYGESHYAKW